MFTILGLTNSDAIRASLGIVKGVELNDAFLTSLKLDEALELEFSDWLPKSVSLYVDLGGSPDSPATQRKLYLLLSKFSTYFCAALTAIPAQTLFHKRLSDGGNEMERQAVDYEKMQQTLLAQAESYKQRFLAAVNGTPSAATLFGAASPSYDPVTDTAT